MIYLEPMILGPKSLINAWLKNYLPEFLDKQQEATISMLCDWLIEPCLSFVTEKCDQFIFCSKMHLTTSFLKLFSCLLEDMK